MLDDPHDLSARAQAFLRRAGTRERAELAATDSLRVRDQSGRVIPAPTELIVKREEFATRFGGLRYDVRRSARADNTRHDLLERWEFDLLDEAWEEHPGWSFEWLGERVASPVSYHVHTDGRFGVASSGPFLEVCPSINHLIESHALIDQVSGWDPQPLEAMKTWAPAGVPNRRLQELLDGLPTAAEASGPCWQWWCSEDVAVLVFHEWTDEHPRPVRVWMWTR